jgi:hypothetical protein
MNASSIQVGLLGGEVLTITAEAGEDEHLIPAQSPSGVSIVACPSGSLKAFVPHTNLAYVLVTAHTEVHAEETPGSASATLGKGSRVRHATHGSGTIQSEKVDEDGEWYVVFESGVSGFVPARELAPEDGS